MKRPASGSCSDAGWFCGAALILRGRFGAAGKRCDWCQAVEDGLFAAAHAHILRVYPLGPLPAGLLWRFDRAQHVAWLAGARRCDSPAVAAAGAATRQACTAAGIDPDAPFVGMMAAAFAE